MCSNKSNMQCGKLALDWCAGHTHVTDNLGDSTGSTVKLAVKAAHGVIYLPFYCHYRVHQSAHCYPSFVHRILLVSHHLTPVSLPGWDVKSRSRVSVRVLE